MNQMSLKRLPIQILLAEDNPDDANLVKEVLRDTNIEHVLITVFDGAAAVDYLRQSGPYAKASRPDLILLDMNLPKLTGLEVLKEIQGARLPDIPIVVLTVSDDQQEIMEALELKMNYYIRKPVEERHLTPLLSLINETWRASGRR